MKSGRGRVGYFIVPDNGIIFLIEFNFNFKCVN